MAGLVALLESRWFVPAVALLGVLARLLLASVLPESPRFYDEHDYQRIAENLVAGAGFAGEHGPTAFRPPGQPLFMASIYALVGATPRAVILTQVSLLAAVPFAVARIGRLVSGRIAVSNAAALVASLHPAIAYASVTLYPVALTTVSLSLGIWFFSEAARGRRGWAVPAGLALGVAAVSTPYFAPLGAFAAVVLLVRRRRVAALALAVCALAPTGVWAARNAAVLGEPVLGTNGGYNLALGQNDRATPRSGNWITPDAARADLPDDELGRDRAYRRSAVAWMRANPGRSAALAVGRAIAVFDSVGKPRTRGSHDSGAAKLIGWALLPCVLLGAAGIVAARRRPEAWLIGAALGCIVLASSLTIVKPRFRYPADPLLFAMAPAALVAAGARLRRLAARSNRARLRRLEPRVP